MARADIKGQATTQKSVRRLRSQIEQERYALSVFALLIIVPGLILVFLIPPLGVILMAIGSFVWIQKDTHYTNELQHNGYLPQDTSLR